MPSFSSLLPAVATSLLIFVSPLLRAEAGPDFSSDIAPILYANCVSCHRPEGPGPFSFIDYADARRRADQIAEVVESRYMPPWKPDVGYGPELQHARGLLDAQIALIQAWADAGAPAGDLAEAPSPPFFAAGWMRGEPDLVVELPEAFTLPAAGLDVYRNFVIPIPEIEGRFVEAVEFLPESRGAIHHAMILVDDSGWARSEDSKDETPGFGSMNVSNVSNPQGQFIGWTPGSDPYEVYPGTEWLLPSSADFVVQLHMLPSGKPERIAPKIGVYFSENGPTLSSGFVLLSNQSIDIPAGESEYRVREELTLPVAANVTGVYPHAHYLGKKLDLFAQLPDGGTLGLLRISDWDFNWQSDYRFVEPARLPAGTTLVMEYVYDNSADNFRNPNDPPQRVELGWNSTDEMAESVVHLFTEKADDMKAIQRAQIEFEIRQSGGPAPYYFEMGTVWENVGELDQAGEAYRISLDADPDQAIVWSRLARVEEKIGRVAESEELHRRAIKLNTVGFEPQVAWGRFLLNQKGDAKGAARIAMEILESEPRDFEASLLLSDVYFNQSWPRLAVKVLNRCKERFTKEAQLRVLLGYAYLASDQLEEAKIELKEVVGGDFSNERSRAYGTDSELVARAYYFLAMVAQREGDVQAFDESLQGTVRFDSGHLDARLALASLAYGRGDLLLARSHLENVLARDAAVLPPMERLFALLPMPEGVVDVVEILMRLGRGDVALDALEVGARMAKDQGRLDLVRQFQAMARNGGL